MKFMRDGKVGIILHHGFGEGWSTSIKKDESKIILSHPLLVETLLMFHEKGITYDQLQDQFYFAFQMLDLEMSFLNSVRLDELTSRRGKPGAFRPWMDSGFLNRLYK